MYTFKNNINHNNFFRFNKEYILNKRWASLPLASKAIYPVISSFCNAKGDAFPSKQTIAILSGCAEKTVGVGLKGLTGFPGFMIERYTTKRGHRANRYKITPSPSGKGQSIFIYKSIFEGGNWSMLNQKSQALYPVMRCFAFFDFEIYVDITIDEEHDWRDVNELYQQRNFDFCNADIAVLAEHAGIGKSSTYEALEELCVHGLASELDPMDGDRRTWGIFVRPPIRYKALHLNEKTIKQHGDSPEFTY